MLEALRGEQLGSEARDAVRRVLVETLLHGSRPELVAAVDETLIGLRPRPSSSLRTMVYWPERIAANKSVRPSLQTSGHHLYVSKGKILAPLPSAPLPLNTQ